jgi:hypothetical protein
MRRNLLSHSAAILTGGIIALAEAMACGTPTIAHPYGSVPEVLENEAYRHQDCTQRSSCSFSALRPVHFEARAHTCQVSSPGMSSECCIMGKSRIGVIYTRLNWLLPRVCRLYLLQYQLHQLRAGAGRA